MCFMVMKVAEFGESPRIQSIALQAQEIDVVAKVSAVHNQIQMMCTFRNGFDGRSEEVPMVEEDKERQGWTSGGWDPEGTRLR